MPCRVGGIMKSISCTKFFEIPVPAADLFPLFSPEGEKLWVPGWDYHNMMGTTQLFEDYVFVTETHDHNAQKAIWLVKRYEPNVHFVQFYRIEPEEKVGVVTVVCTELGTARTKVQVTYKYIALSAAGEKFIAGFTESFYEEFINEWERLLLKHFELIA